jgi:SAM-dependent methyltransferase
MQASFWDARYAEEGFAYGTEPNDFVREVAHRIRPGGKVLCLAEGEGRNAAFLAARGHAVLAVDQSTVGLEKARRLAAERGATIDVLAADLAVWAAEEGAFDAVVATSAHLPRPARSHMHAAAVRALAPGGVLILEAYTPRQLAFRTGGPPDEALLVEPEHLREELAGLTLERLEEIEREMAEGKYHRGRSAVVRALGVKPT